MTLNGVMTADPRYFCGIVAEFLVNLENVARRRCNKHSKHTERQTKQRTEISRELNSNCSQ